MSVLSIETVLIKIESTHIITRNNNSIVICGNTIVVICKIFDNLRIFKINYHIIIQQISMIHKSRCQICIFGTDFNNMYLNMLTYVANMKK